MRTEKSAFLFFLGAIVVVAYSEDLKDISSSVILAYSTPNTNISMSIGRVVENLFVDYGHSFLQILNVVNSIAPFKFDSILL